MKLEDQVCSFELSKKLREIDIKQNSLFYWLTKEGEEPRLVYDAYKNIPLSETHFLFSAFIASEIFEKLPWSLLIDHNPCQLLFTGGKPYILEYRPIGFLNKSILHQIDNAHDENMATCGAKMLVNLVENSLVEFS